MRKELRIKDIEADLNKEFVEYLEQENLYRDGFDLQEVNFIKKLALT